MFCRLLYFVVVAGALTVVGCQGDRTEPVTRLPPPYYVEPDFHVERPTPPPPPQPEPPAPKPTVHSLRGKTVVVDAGHGGKDPGTRGVSPVNEKTIVLNVANEVARLLRDRGANVVSTRTTDRFLELDERAEIAQRHRADLFVSIHADSAQRKSASGSTIYICRVASSQSQSAARSIQRALTSAGIECRGIHQANYRVLVAHTRPAVLVECGFLTNAGDSNRLNTQWYRNKIAAAIASGVADYLGG